jgi:hypothetical protein
MPTALAECSENTTCYALIGILWMLAAEGCGHLPRLKELAVSCNASLLQDFPKDLSKIAKRLVTHWWTQKGMPYCMQKIEEENGLSSGTLFLVDKFISPSNDLFLTSRRPMRIPSAIGAPRMLTLP